MRHPYYQNYKQKQQLTPGEQRALAHEHIQSCNAQRVRLMHARILPVERLTEEGSYHVSAG